jgi:hypothetical protein
MALPDFFPKTDQVFDIGGPNGLLLVGQSFDRSFSFKSLVKALDSSTCGLESADFTGFTLVGDIVDAGNAVLASFTVTPSAGDATGVFALHLDPADVTTSLRDDAVKWKFRMVYGSVTNKLLIYANFKVT